jgi:hypothetical protein
MFIFFPFVWFVLSNHGMIIPTDFISFWLETTSLGTAPFPPLPCQPRALARFAHPMRWSSVLPWTLAFRSRGWSPNFSRTSFLGSEVLLR